MCSVGLEHNLTSLHFQENQYHLLHDDLLFYILLMNKHQHLSVYEDPLLLVENDFDN